MSKQKLNIVHLRRGKEESLERRHPWVFSGAIERITEHLAPLAEGDLVDVVTKSGDFIARGHWQIGSIAVRVLTFEEEEINQSWWNRRLSEALGVRKALGLVDNADTTCYRLVHGEGDLLPGLVIDILNYFLHKWLYQLGLCLPQIIASPEQQCLQKTDI